MFRFFFSFYQLQQEGAEVGPHVVRLWSRRVRNVDQVQEQTSVDVEVLWVEEKKRNLIFLAPSIRDRTGDDSKVGRLTFDLGCVLVPVDWVERRVGRRAAAPSEPPPP